MDRGRVNKAGKTEEALRLIISSNNIEYHILATRIAVSVPLPAPLMPCPGEPAITFSMWLKMFENYMLIIGAAGDSWPDARKCTVLLHTLGPEGQRLFYARPDTGDTYASAMEGMKRHFVPKVSVIAECHKF